MNLDKLYNLKQETTDLRVDLRTESTLGDGVTIALVLQTEKLRQEGERSFHHGGEKRRGWEGLWGWASDV